MKMRNDPCILDTRHDLRKKVSLKFNPIKDKTKILCLRTSLKLAVKMTSHDVSAGRCFILRPRASESWCLYRRD